MKKSWYSIEASAAQSAVRDISIYDEIGIWGVSARSFLADLAAIQEDEISLSINSLGGSVLDGIAIFNGLRASGKTITVTVMGVAASIASFIAMAGHKVRMPANSFMMLHLPSADAYDGTADEFREIASVLDKFGQAVTAAYAKRWKGTPESLAETLSKDSWLLAAECQEHGLCDEILDPIEAKARFSPDSWELPEQVRALLKPTARVKPPEPEPKPDSTFAASLQALLASASMQSYITVFATDPAIGNIEQARAAISQAREVIDICAAVGLADQAPALIRAKKALPDAKAALSAVLVARDEASVVDTVPRLNQQSSGAAMIDPKALWEQIHQMSRSKS